jgi:hypothetical protein
MSAAQSPYAGDLRRGLASERDAGGARNPVEVISRNPGSAENVLYSAFMNGLPDEPGGGSGGGAEGEGRPEGFMLIVRGGGMLVLGLGGCLW